jgi:hypothetical protein
VILKYKLWKAEHKTWGEYCQEVSNEPWSISKSSIEHGVSTIDEYLERGMTLRNIIGVLGKAPMAGKAMLEAPQEALPDGDINKAAEIIQALGSDEAGRAVNDWQGKPTFTTLSAVHDEASQTLYLEVRRTEADGRDQRYDYRIEQVDREAAELFWMVRLKVRTDSRAFK